MLKALGRRVLTPALGRKRWQRTFESLYELSLAGMNFGEGNDPLRSGEQRVLELIAQRVGIEPVIFDVGANRGTYTRLLLDGFPPGAQIFAFEPSPSTFRMLKSNLGSEAGVRLENVGLSDKERATTLYSPGEGSKLGSVHDTSDRLQRIGMPLSLKEAVSLTTLDRFCAREGVERVDFLKLDVEGHELKALHGGRGLIHRGLIGAIQFEFSAANVESRTFFKDFFDLLHDRYRLHRILQDGLQPIDQYRETYEVFKRATNYLAMVRSSLQEYR